MPNLNGGLCSAGAATLHVGDGSVRLDTVRRTTPSLGVSVHGTTYWGSMYGDAAPSGALHIGEYWVGQNCAAGLYTADGLTACADCGPGYYCPGGRDRTVCTNGAIGCPGANETADGMPSAGAPINTPMTQTQVQQYIPPTHIKQWREITCCYALHTGADYQRPETVNDINNACASGAIGPGTYLFVTRYPGGDSSDLINGPDSLSGGPGKSSAYIAVFDRRVEYRSVNGNNIFHHFVDGENFPYESYTMAFPDFDNIWANEIAVNVSGIDTVVSPQSLCVFELK